MSLAGMYVVFIGNRGGPKPDRVKVENIEVYQNMVRAVSDDADEATPSSSESRAIATSQLSEHDYNRLMSHGVVVEQKFKPRVSEPVSLAPAPPPPPRDTAATVYLNKTPTSAYVIRDASLQQRDATAGYVLQSELSLPSGGELNAAGGAAAIAVMQPGGHSVDMQDLAYSSLPFTVQSVNLGDGSQNLAIQILHSATQESLLLPDKS